MKTVHDMVDAAKAEIHEVSVGEAEAAISGADYLIDVREDDEFHDGHIAGAINIPHPRLNFNNLAEFPLDTLFVVYCAGPHCNGTEKAAIRLAKLGRPVKKMIGGVTGWLDEGFELRSGLTEEGEVTV